MKQTQQSTIYLSPPHMCGKEVKYIEQTFAENWIAPVGPNIDRFEEEIANYIGVNGAVAVSSGTAAIHLALILLGVGKGDTVFCSSLTFVASANPILYEQATPVFIDSEEDTWNMCPKALEKALKEHALIGQLPKVVIVVNLYGQSAKMDEIISLCSYYKVPIIEDSAESLGSTYQGKASGSFGQFGIYSFNGNKIITSSGGGMLVSNDREALKKARFLATQAKDDVLHYEHSQLGYNYRMSNIVAAIGRGQLEVLDERVDARRKVFSNYYEQLSQLPGVSFMPELENSRSNRWLTTLTIDENQAGISANELLLALRDNNIEARHVWKPLHLQPLYKGTKFYTSADREPVSERLFREGLCLPSGSNMTEEQFFRVVNSFKKCFQPSHV